MKKWIFGLGLVVLALYLSALIAIPRISPRPEGLGVAHGQLKPCPGTPNCISTQSAREDAYEKREPLALATTPKQAIDRLATIINKMPRTKIIEHTDSYLYAEFRTFAMRFIDDVEFYADPATGLLHYRSASRLGRKDFGVNGKRIGEMLEAYNKP